MAKITRLAFVGFGSFAKQLLNLGVDWHDRSLTAFDPSVLCAKTCKRQLETFIAFGVQGCFSIEDAINGAQIIILSDHDHLASPWQSELLDHLCPQHVVVDFRSQNTNAFKTRVEEKHATYLQGEITLNQDNVSISSPNVGELQQLFQSMDVPRQNILVQHAPLSKYR